MSRSSFDVSAVDVLGPVTDHERQFALALFANERDWYGDEDEPIGGFDDTGLSRPDRAVAEAMLSHAADLADAFVLRELDLTALETPLLALLVAKRIDELTAMLAAHQAVLLVQVAEPVASDSFLDEVHVETEVALARGISPTLAGLEIELSRALATTFPQFRDALARGEVSAAHCRALVAGTRCVTDPVVLARIGELALDKARGRTVALFVRALRRLVARYDRDALARRAEAVRFNRDVHVRQLDDGLGQLVYVDEWSKVNAVGKRIRNAGRATQLARKRLAADDKARARPTAPATGTARSRTKQARKLAAQERLDRRQGLRDEYATASGCRADALLALVLGREHDDGSVVLDPETLVQVEVGVVIDLQTLRGEADGFALLDGEPVPADVGREWAARARTYRRLVTDPVTGHLLDKGRTYMADDVRDFVLARDGRCRLPICGISHADRLQVDHAVPAPHGPTSAANLGALSTTHHQLKTNGYLDITDSRADGSALLTTAWGQRIVIPPRAYLDDPEPRAWDRSSPIRDDDGPPPF